MPVRLDKWLQVARVFKTRNQATQACHAGRVRVNQMPAKAHRALAVGDRVEIRFRGFVRRLAVREVRDRPLPKAEAHRLWEDLTPVALANPRRRSPSEPGPEATARGSGLGRPTKRDRRKIDRLRQR